MSALVIFFIILLVLTIIFLIISGFLSAIGAYEIYGSTSNSSIKLAYDLLVAAAVIAFLALIVVIIVLIVVFVVGGTSKDEIVEFFSLNDQFKFSDLKLLAEGKEKLNRQLANSIGLIVVMLILFLAVLAVAILAGVASYKLYSFKNSSTAFTRAYDSALASAILAAIGSGSLLIALILYLLIRNKSKEGLDILNKKTPVLVPAVSEVKQVEVKPVVAEVKPAVVCPLPVEKPSACIPPIKKEVEDIYFTSDCRI